MSDDAFDDSNVIQIGRKTKEPTVDSQERVLKFPTLDQALLTLLSAKNFLETGEVDVIFRCGPDYFIFDTLETAYDIKGDEYLMADLIQIVPK